MSFGQRSTPLLLDAPFVAGLNRPRGLMADRGSVIARLIARFERYRTWTEEVEAAGLHFVGMAARSDLRALTREVEAARARVEEARAELAALERARASRRARRLAN